MITEYSALVHFGFFFEKNHEVVANGDRLGQTGEAWRGLWLAQGWCWRGLALGLVRAEVDVL